MLKAQKYCLPQCETWKAQKQTSVPTQMGSESREAARRWSPRHAAGSDKGNHITPHANKTDGHLVEKSGVCVVQSAGIYNF